MHNILWWLSILHIQGDEALTSLPEKNYCNIGNQGKKKEEEHGGTKMSRNGEGEDYPQHSHAYKKYRQHFFN